MKLDNLNLASASIQRITLLLLLTFFILLGILSSPGITVTRDEPLHYNYGRLLLEGKADRIDDSSMPVSAINALPAYVAGFLADGALKSILERSFIARLVTILFSAAFACLVFRWSRSLYGFAAALVSTILYILDPNIIAHSQLVTTDVFVMGMMTLSFYWLWKFANSRQTSDGLLCACAIGLSQLTKYTAVALFPLGLLTLVIHDLPMLREHFRNERLRGVARYAGQLAAYCAIGVLVSLVIINAGFLFDRVFTPLRDYRFKSSTMQALQTDMPVLGNMPVPVPYPYLDGLDWMQHTEQTADRYGNIYLLGRTSKPNGFPGYYFVASALKVAIATQVFILAALVLYCAMPQRRAHFFHDEAFFLVPFIFFTIYFNFFFNAQTGIRYYLVIFPLLYVFVGHLFADWKLVPVWARTASAALVLYLAVSVLSYFPYYIPYFNELVWDKTQTYKYLSDSNLDWGQSRNDLQRFLVENPNAVVNPDHIQSGVLIVEADVLVGVLSDPAQDAWLRDNFKPVQTVAYSYFVYKITPEEITALCSSTAYCK